MKIRIVESVRSFESASLARAWALANVRKRSATNKQIGMVIRIGRRAIAKTTSESAICRSIGFDAYELAQIEIPAWKQADSCSEEQTSTPRAGIINPTELRGGASAEC